jgi:hypothetical protein
MEHHMAKRLVVQVTLEDRGDNGLRVTSEALPNLILSGADKKAVCDAIAPAIRAILEYKGYNIARIEPDRSLDEVVKQPLPRNVDMHVHHQQFVVELRDAA